MRETHKIQPTLAEPRLDQPHARELEVVADLLDDHRMLGVIVAQDLSRGNSRSRRRSTTTAKLPPWSDPLHDAPGQRISYGPITPATEPVSLRGLAHPITPPLSISCSRNEPIRMGTSDVPGGMLRQ